MTLHLTEGSPVPASAHVPVDRTWLHLGDVGKNPSSFTEQSFPSPTLKFLNNLHLQCPCKRSDIELLMKSILISAYNILLSGVKHAKGQNYSRVPIPPLSISSYRFQACT